MFNSTLGSRRRRLGPLSAFAVVALAMAGCSNSSSDSGTSGASSSAATQSSTAAAPTAADSDYSIVGVIPDTSDPFFQTMVCGAQDEAEKLGASFKAYTVSTLDANGIATAYQTALLTNPDGVMVTPVNSNQFLAQNKQQMSKGVPIVTNNPSSPQAEYKYVYTGADATSFVGEVSKSISEGDGSMVFLGGAPGIKPLESRTVPFFEAMQKQRTDLEPLSTEYSNFDVNKAASDVSALILAHPDLKLIVASNGADAAGAASALKNSGKADDITLVAFDATPSEVSALKDGTIDYLIAQPAYDIGKQSVDEIVGYLNDADGGAVEPAGEIALPNQLLTKDNVDDEDNAGYIYKTKC